MKQIFRLCAVIAIFFLTLSQCNAQTTPYKVGDQVKIGLKNGMSFSGYVQSFTDEEIVLRIPDAGMITIYTKNIGGSGMNTNRHVETNTNGRIAQKIPGEFEFDNPLYSKYYIGESAISIKKGEGYYQNILIIGNFFSYGITDNFSLSGGFESISLALGEMPVFFINPKFSVHSENEKYHFAVGAFTGLYTNNINSDGGVAGSLYGTFTIGDLNNNFSIGSGLGFGGEGILDSPILQIAGMTRMSDRIGFVGEIIFTNFDRTWEGGATINLRIMTEKAAFDIGGFYAQGADFVLPVASAAIRF